MRRKKNRLAECPINNHYDASATGVPVRSGGGGRGVGSRAQSGVNMDLVTASAISIGVLGGIGALLLLSPFAMGLQIGVALIGLATFYQCGGKDAGLGKAIVHNIFGAVMALIMLLLVIFIPLSGAIGAPLWIGICVLITLFVLVVASKWATLGDIPASILGYASMAAFVGSSAAVTGVSFDNPFVNVAISLIIGAVLGYLAEKLTGAVAKK